MIVVDWRDVAAADIQPLYDAEADRWRSLLGWDLAPSWRIVEEARLQGRLPGFIARDRAGAVTGWTFQVLHGDVLQIGGLVGSRAASVRELLEAILGSPEAAIAARLSCFVFPVSPAVESALVRRGFQIDRHLYLRRALDCPTDADGPPVTISIPVASLRPWRRADDVACVRLLARAYAGLPESRSFAPNGRLDEWAQYLGQLVQTSVCGTLLEPASFVLEVDGEVVGLVMTTVIGPGIAHVAQLAVAPEVRRTGAAAALTRQALAVSAAAGCESATLLVAESNQAARGLYQRLGFSCGASFLSAGRTARIRTRSAALVDQRCAAERGGHHAAISRERRLSTAE